MDFNKFKNKIKRGKENIKYLFKETINLFYGNKTHASFFWLSIIGIFLVHYFVSESAASLLKIFALAFFAFNTTRIARGLEDMLENITPKDVEIFSFVVIITEISLGFLMSAKYFNGFMADFFSVVILALIFSQYLRYLNNKEYKEYEKELKIDAINNPKPPIMEPIIQTFKEKRTKSMETILEASSPLKVEENNLIVDERAVDQKKSDFETFETQAYNQTKPSMDLEKVSKIIKEEENSLDLERARAEKLALAASEIVTMDIEFEKIYPEMIDFEDTAKLDEIEVNVKEEDLEMEESVSEEDFDDIFEDFSEEVDTEIEQEDLEDEQIEVEIEVEIEEESKENEEIIEESKESEEVDEEIEVEEAPQKENKFEITFDDDDFSLISKSDSVIDDIQEDEDFKIDLELDLTSVVDDEVNVKESLKEKIDDTPKELEKAKEETVEEEYDDLEFELSQEDVPKELENDNNKDVDLSFEKDEDVDLELELENPMDLDIDNNEDLDLSFEKDEDIDLSFEKDEDIDLSFEKDEDIDLSFEKDDDLELELENENPMGSDNDEIEFDLDDMGLEFDLTSDEEDEDDEIDERFNILDSDIDLSFETDEK